jgi:hypothetical protein
VFHPVIAQNLHLKYRLCFCSSSYCFTCVLLGNVEIICVIFIQCVAYLATVTTEVGFSLAPEVAVVLSSVSLLFVLDPGSRQSFANNPALFLFHILSHYS